MPSLLPILSYDVPCLHTDTSSSIIVSNDIATGFPKSAEYKYTAERAEPAAVFPSSCEHGNTNKLSQEGAEPAAVLPTKKLPQEGNGSAAVFPKSGEHSSSALKKHTTICEELPEKKKHNKENGHVLAESVVSDNESTADLLGQPQGISDAVRLMSKAVFHVQMALYNGLQTNLQLQAARPLITQSEYADVVTERSNDKQCGYPLCGKSLKLNGKAKNPKYKISLREHKVYDLEETRLFCSTECAVSSKTYGAGLQSTREGLLEQDKLEEIIARVRGLNLSSSSPRSPTMSASAAQNAGVVVHERIESQPVDFEFSSSSAGSVEGYTPRNYVSESKPLKSAIKQSPRKHQRITWADEMSQESVQQDTFSFVTDFTQADDSKMDGFNESKLDESGKERLKIANSVAEALSEAANASLRGDVQASDAASSTGLSILSALSTDTENGMLPETAATVEDDDFSNRSTWFDAPPTAFKAEVSMFGMLWMALDEWITSNTLAYIYGRDGATDEFRTVNGRVVGDYNMESSPDILRTISSCISRVLPDVVQAMGVGVPISFIEQAVGRLLRTMNFAQALPPFTTKNWRVITVLFLDALSVHCVAALGDQLKNKRALLRKVVVECGTSDGEYESYKELLLPMGRLPPFSSMGGG